MEPEGLLPFSLEHATGKPIDLQFDSVGGKLRVNICRQLFTLLATAVLGSKTLSLVI
jgi:hypothetical protein